jgi:molybdopterin-binding protein
MRNSCRLSAVSAASYRLSQAARLLGVSDDTVRRWVDAGRLTASRHEHGPQTIDGAELAAFAVAQAAEVADLDPIEGLGTSARNRLVGLVTKVTQDTVMAQVELQVGRFRIVSLISSEAATELGLEPGVLAVASVKSTNVVIEVPAAGP